MKQYRHIISLDNNNNFENVKFSVNNVRTTTQIYIVIRISNDYKLRLFDDYYNRAVNKLIKDVGSDVIVTILQN